MKYLLLSLFLFLNLAFAFDSVTVSDKIITLHKYGYFTTEKELTPLEALKYTNENRLSQLPKKAKSFGFDSNTYWFRFDVSTPSHDEKILAVKNLVASSCELFVFENKKLIRHDVNGYNISPDKRPIDSFALRFKLEVEKTNIVYLVKINSSNPHYTAFEFGKTSQVNKGWGILNFITSVVFGISMIIIFYSLAIFVILKDRTFLYYSIYIGGLFMLDMAVLGFIPIIYPPLESIKLGLFVGLFLQIEQIGLVLFTINFLRLDKNYSKLKKQLLYFLYFSIFTALLVPMGHGLEKITVVSIYALQLFLLYIGFKTYLNGYKPSLFYLLATGVAMVSFFCFMIMNQGGGIPYTIWTYNLVSFALIWDILFLSFAIAHRIRLLQEENTKNERLVIMESRQKVIGELTGNIAHQWRQPLNTLGAIIANVEAKIKYDHLSEKELIESCQLSTSVLQHLSETINTLQDFFVDQTEKKENFDLNELIKSLISFLNDLSANHHIRIDFNFQKPLFIHSNRNLLSQVIMNILLNAKDILIKRNGNKNRFITITTSVEDEKVVITLNDNGGGITIEPIEKIFELFISSKTDGSGIGLYLSKNIIEKLGGILNASNTSEGAKFLIELPISNN